MDVLNELKPPSNDLPHLNIEDSNERQEKIEPSTSATRKKT
jgi:hypothetical protein